MSKSKKAREEEVVSEPKHITEIREELHADQARIAALDKEDVMDLSEQLVTCRYKLGFLVDCFINVNPKNNFEMSIDGIRGLTYIIRDIEKTIKAVSEKLFKIAGVANE